MLLVVAIMLYMFVVDTYRAVRIRVLLLVGLSSTWWCDGAHVFVCAGVVDGINHVLGAVRLVFFFLLLLSFSAVYDGGAIAVDTSVSSYNNVEELAGASMQAINDTVDGVSVELLCENTTFVSNVAGERGGSLYSNTVSPGGVVCIFFWFPSIVCCSHVKGAS